MSFSFQGSVRFGGFTTEAAKTSAPTSGNEVAVVEISAVVQGSGPLLFWSFRQD